MDHVAAPQHHKWTSSLISSGKERKHSKWRASSTSGAGRLSGLGTASTFLFPEMMSHPSSRSVYPRIASPRRRQPGKQVVARLAGGKKSVNTLNRRQHVCRPPTDSRSTR